MKNLVFSVYVCLLLAVRLPGFAADEIPLVSLLTDKTPGLAAVHGLDKLAAALRAKNIVFEKVSSLNDVHGKLVIVAGLPSGAGAAAQLLKAGRHNLPAEPEALTIWKTKAKSKPAWVISGFDDRGLMYGLLDVADRIGWSTDQQSPLSEVKEISEKPAVSQRAISIYTMNRTYWESRLYNEAYWERYLDVLAQNRFNSLVVIFGYENGGFLAPCYPYFFNVDGFDSVRMVGITPQQQQKNLAAFNWLIRMAHERGISLTAGIWDHIYRGGVQGGGIPGTKDSPNQPVPGLVWGLNGDNLTTYTKLALAKFINQVPDLDAIEFRMHDESGLKNGEQDAFWLDVFKMIKQTAPDMRLVLRAKELKESVIQSAINVGLNFTIETKYWMEQMGLPYHPTQINPEKSFRRHSYSDLLRYPQRYKMHWRLWNGGTSRILLWGDPEYVRRFAETTHLYDGDGFEVNEPLATKMEAQPHDAQPFDLLNPAYRYYDWEFERYWHFFQVFGRIGYNPDTSPDIWKKEFVRRFGKNAGPIIETALHRASQVLPRIIASSYPYTSFPTTRGWAEKQRLGDLPTFAKAELTDLQQFATFDEEAKLLTEGGETAKMLPSANSRWFEQTATDIDKLVTQAQQATGTAGGKEFTSTITDLKILAGLAQYHANRIRAAIYYRLFERTQNAASLDDAIAFERKAVAAWQQIVTAAADVYGENLMMGVCVADLCGHWKDELALLKKGLTGLEQKRSGFTAVAAANTTQHYNLPVSGDTTLFQFTHQTLTSAAAGKPITIRITVHAKAGVKWVRLLYRGVNQEQAYKTLPMTATGEADVYQASVPADQVDPTWDFMYFIQVMDKNSRGMIYPDVNKETPYRIVKLVR